MEPLRTALIACDRPGAVSLTWSFFVVRTWVSTVAVTCVFDFISPSLCYSATLLLCYSATLLLCYSATLLLWVRIWGSQSDNFVTSEGFQAARLVITRRLQSDNFVTCGGFQSDRLVRVRVRVRARARARVRVRVTVRERVRVRVRAAVRVFHMLFMTSISWAFSTCFLWHRLAELFPHAFFMTSISWASSTCFLWHRLAELFPLLKLLLNAPLARFATFYATPCALSPLWHQNVWLENGQTLANYNRMPIWEASKLKWKHIRKPVYYK